MNVAVARPQGVAQTVEHVDVLIVGAGISGIDAAYHLQQHCPGKRFVLLETQASFGGTWRTHRFPGIRSDSDLFTFGFGWKPWKGVPIATAPEILKYLDEALDEQDIRRHVRYRHKVLSAAWSSEDKRWALEVERAETDDTVTYTCDFLWMCQGYYRHDEGYTPTWPGMDRFTGRVVHPQTWPADLDYKGKRVIVIGSGATAATIIPAMADDCAHITMLQRSPTYFYPRPNVNELAEMLRPLDLPDQWKHECVRQRILFDSKEIARRSFEEPEGLKAELLAAARAYLGPDFDIETHFTPVYRPWQQRLAVIPDGDLFKAIRKGQVSVVTDTIESFTEKGIMVSSGEELAADIIVTATGFHMAKMGDIPFFKDGQPLDFADTFAHRGILFSEVPNLAWVFGYLRTSWTMRADMVAEFVCRLLAHMDAKGAKVVTPRLRDEEKDMPARPLVTAENFSAGYLQRAIHLLPKVGDRAPWTFSQDYYQEKDEIPAADLDDGTLVYE